MAFEPTGQPLLHRDGEDVILDVAQVAPRLGLGIEEFRAALRHGAVKGAIEAGRDDDAGRTRVTLRRGDRVWCAIIEPDGHIAEQ